MTFAVVTAGSAVSLVRWISPSRSPASIRAGREVRCRSGNRGTTGTRREDRLALASRHREEFEHVLTGLCQYCWHRRSCRYTHPAATNAGSSNSQSPTWSDRRGHSKWVLLERRSYLPARLEVRRDDGEPDVRHHSPADAEPVAAVYGPPGGQPNCGQREEPPT